jgi:hypothetical protein
VLLCTRYYYGHNTRIWWAGHAARIKDVRNAYTILAENLKVRVHLEDVGVDGKEERGMDSSRSEKVPVAGSCEHGNEHLGFIKGGEFSDQLSDCQLLKSSAACYCWSRSSRDENH